MKKQYLLISAFLFLRIISQAQYTDLVDFNGISYPQGLNPYGSLIPSLTGDTLYGMSCYGGYYGAGTIFSIGANGSGYTDMYDFDGFTGAYPYGSLTLLGNMLYGMTAYGGGAGNIFSFNTSSSDYTDMYDFSGGSDGAYPFGSLALSVTSDSLYGMTSEDGIVGKYGNVFSIATDGSAFTDLFDFNGTNGTTPFGSLTLSYGVFYGMTYQGGANNLGTIFSINGDGSGYTDLLDFNGTNGANPEGSLTFSVTGDSLFGMTNSGGANGDGTVFALLYGFGYFDLLDFNGTNGASPYADLTLEKGVLYGMTNMGGADNDGAVFSLNMNTGGYTDLYDFSGINGTSPYGSLTFLNSNNELYGMTSQGGANSNGLIFGYNILTVDSFQVTNVSCRFGGSFNATAIPTGGALPYTYSWNPGGSTEQTASGLSAGSYTVTVTDNIGSTATSVAIISNISVSISQITNVICNGGSNGSIIASPSGGTMPYVYSWAGGPSSAFGSSGLASLEGPEDILLTAGTYTITVTDSCGYSASASATVTEPPPLSVSVTASSSIICPGNSDTLTNSVSGGTPPYTYSWSPATGLNCDTCQTTIAAPLTSTTYTITVTDNNGCSSSTTATINTNCVGGSCGNPYISYVDSCNINIPLNDSTLWFKFTATNRFAEILLFDPSDALNGRVTSITLYSGSCGTLDSITGGTFFAGEDTVISIADTELTVGATYYIKTIKPIRGSSDNSRFFSLCVLPNPTFPHQFLPISSSPGGAMGPLRRSIGTNLTNNCVANPCGDIVSNGNFEVMNRSCSYFPDNYYTYGMIYDWDFQFNSGYSDVSCWWGIDADIGNFFSSCITPTVTANCSNHSSVSSVPNNYGGCNVDDHSSVNGWSGLSYGYIGLYMDYLYIGNNGNYDREYVMQELLNPMTNGTTYKVSFWTELMPNSNGYITAGDMGLLFTSEAVTLGTIWPVNNTAAGDVIDIATGNPGVPQITGTCTTCSCTPAFNTPNTWVNITGLYTANGMEKYIILGNFNTTSAHTSTGSYNVNDAVEYYFDDVSIVPNLTLTATASPSSMCASSLTGVTLSASSGFGSYTWMPGSLSGQTVTVYPTTTTTYTVTTCASYTATVTVTVVSLDITITPGCSMGSATLTASTSGGTIPYTYSWSSGGGTTSTLTGVSAGTYTVTVTDNDGCTSTASITINSLSVSTSITTDASCYGGSNGSISATASGGISPYTYSWSPVGGTNSTLTGLSSGTYTITVTDNCGALATTSATITQPASAVGITISAISTISCYGGTGTITANPATGGISPYTYSWSGGGGTNLSTVPITSGTYTITVSDIHGCTATASATLTQPAILNVSAGVTANVSCYGGNNGSVSATPSGGTTPYSYSWSAGGTNSTQTGLSIGTYTITITDNHGCTAMISAVITQPAALTVSTLTTNETCSGSNNGTASATPSGGTSPYAYSWNDGSSQTTATATDLSAGSYTVTVSDAEGCTATYTSIIDIDGPPGTTTISLVGSDYDLCPGGRSVELMASSASALSLSYNWGIYSEYPSGAFTLGSSTDAYNYVSAIDYSANIDVEAQAVNACGTSAWATYGLSSVSASDCGGDIALGNHDSSSANNLTMQETQLQKISGNICKVYPNSTNTELTIEIRTDNNSEFNQGKEYYFYVYDQLGQLIEKNVLTRNLITIPIKNVATGVYYYRIIDDNQNLIKTDKLLIIR